MLLKRCVCCNKLLSLSSKEPFICNNCSFELNNLYKDYSNLENLINSNNFDKAEALNTLKNILLNLGKFKLVETPFSIDNCIELLKALVNVSESHNVPLVSSKEVNTTTTNLELIDSTVSLNDTTIPINHEVKPKLIPHEKLQEFQKNNVFNNNILMYENKLFIAEDKDQTEVNENMIDFSKDEIPKICFNSDLLKQK